ncbi:sigma-54-dependent Fis family transcriptional regulator [Marinospirillum sp.]|uniref:sigma-54 interaction domain-containing protein n=1 Tax=Marinospirillum sp. TaxID=2183934 RepID=UPI00286FEB1A|nr:sigma-54-dependent Fis family transcriptional regulator [Marinospirillum sp.]MDR9468056.1 sigma-54-dependent Fis family transcriptional regulator [Marinospirillum sp.]
MAEIRNWTQAEMNSLLDAISEPAALISLDYQIKAANQAYYQTYGSTPGILGRHCYDVSHGFDQPCDLAGESCPLKLCLETRQKQRVLHQHQTPLGEEHVDVEMSPIHNQQGDLIAFLEILHLVKEAKPRAAGGGLIGRSSAFNEMLALMRRAAPSEITVLLLGETGTGKELVARALHDASPRSAKPFITVECSGLPETLFESELFGHEKGAFTGALGRKNGLVAAAHGGTLFLDEIGEIPLSQQVKLLRLIETGSYRSVGGMEPQYANFRLVCATHRDLEEQVKAGAFRADLYYRISAFPLHLPSLAERREDLPLLVEALLQRLPGGEGVRVAESTLECLRHYAFPGNIRELRNFLERGILLADKGVIAAEHLPEFCRKALAPGAEQQNQGLFQPGAAPLPLRELEKRYLQELATSYPGDRKQLAQELQISERSLYRKLKGLYSQD